MFLAEIIFAVAASYGKVVEGAFAAITSVIALWFVAVDKVLAASLTEAAESELAAVAKVKLGVAGLVAVLTDLAVATGTPVYFVFSAGVSVKPAANTKEWAGYGI